MNLEEEKKVEEKCNSWRSFASLLAKLVACLTLIGLYNQLIIYQIDTVSGGISFWPISCCSSSSAAAKLTQVNPSNRNSERSWRNLIASSLDAANNTTIS